MIGNGQVIKGVRKDKVVFVGTVHDKPAPVCVEGPDLCLFRKTEVLIDHLRYHGVDLDHIDPGVRIVEFHITGKGVTASADSEGTEGGVPGKPPLKDLRVNLSYSYSIWRGLSRFT